MEPPQYKEDPFASEQFKPVSEKEEGFQTPLNDEVEKRGFLKTSAIIVTLLIAFAALDLGLDLQILFRDFSPTSESNINASARNFYLTDAEQDVTADDNDHLIKMTWDSHYSHDTRILWSDLDVMITTVDGNNQTIDCGLPGESEGKCHVYEQSVYHDKYWEKGEAVTIAEFEENLCEGSCKIVVKVTMYDVEPSVSKTLLQVSVT